MHAGEITACNRRACSERRGRAVAPALLRTNIWHPPRVEQRAHAVPERRVYCPRAVSRVWTRSGKNLNVPGRIAPNSRYGSAAPEGNPASAFAAVGALRPRRMLNFACRVSHARKRFSKSSRIEIDITGSTTLASAPAPAHRTASWPRGRWCTVDLLPAMAGVGSDPARQPHRLTAVGA
jgi:hypothetical protein